MISLGKVLLFYIWKNTCWRSRFMVCFLWKYIYKFFEIYFLQEKDKEQVVEINLGCRDDSVQRYRLFVKTFLGFGANEAIARYHRNSVLSQKENEMLGLTSSNPISDPCLPNGLTTNLTVNLDLNRVIDEAIKTKLTEEQLIFLYGTGTFLTASFTFAVLGI